MLSLADFLNHGLLPFVGRSTEIDTLMDFWRSSIDAGDLRLAIITAEAGAGKTRLFDQLLPRIAREGGMVVRARLYPDATASIAPLMAQALGKSGMAFRLLRVTPNGTMAEVVATFRRVARLRPVVLMIEDLHLLPAEGLQELGTLLYTIADENLTVLCASRPMDPPTRGVLEPYTVLDIELNGLDRESVAAMWETLFSSAPRSTDLEAIIDVTLGNPLAIRSALRGAISSSMMAPTGTGEQWHVAVEQEPFERALRQGVRVLSEGMAAQLSESERENAAQLACLGEIFSREAAEEMIADAGKVIDHLLYKGLLITTDMPAQPLAGTSLKAVPTSQHPLLAFTHSLVHRQFVERATVDPERIIRIIGLELPLYSMLPFELIDGSSTAVDIPIEIGRQAILRSLRIIHSLDFSPDRHRALLFWRVAETIKTMFADRWGEEEKKLQADLIFHKLAILRHTPLSPEHGPLITALFEITAEPTPPELLLFRMRAFAYQVMIGAEKNPSIPHSSWKEVQKFIEIHPSMHFHFAYLHYLHVVAHCGRVYGDEKLLRMVEQKSEELLASDNIPSDFRQNMTLLLTQFFLLDFSTKEELERRKNSLAAIEANPSSSNDISFLSIKLDMLEAIGEIENIQKLCDYLIERTASANPRAYVHSLHTKIRSVVGQGRITTEQLREQSNAIIAKAPEWYRARFREAIGETMIRTGVLAGEIPWARSIAATFAESEIVTTPALMITLALYDTEAPLPLDTSGPEWQQEPLLRILVEHLGNGTAPDPATIESIGQALAAPMLRNGHLVQFYALLGLIEVLGIVEHYREAIRAATTNALLWLEPTRQFVFMRGLLNQLGNYLDSKQEKEWRRRTAEIERELATTNSAKESSPHITISMLGAIEVTIPGKEPVRPRGARLRLFLGLLVADRIMKHHLTFQEMCAIVASDTSGDRGRKALNEAVYRLRELLGHEAIITDDEVPRLNMALMDVDIIQAHERLAAADAALHADSILQASRALLAALKLTRGEVPFPGLYENFFEHVREEFDYLLRSTLIGVGRALLVEGDLESAEELLERGFESMPDDLEVAELLAETLEQMGRKASAERIRRRAGLAND